MKKFLSALLSVTTSAFIFTGISASGFALAQEPEPVEILSMRSEYEKHFDNGDGTITAFIDTVPLHYKSDGEWLEIDNTLVLDDSGNYVNKSNSMDVALSSSASVSVLNAVDDEPLASIDYNGYSISWGFVNDQPETAINASIGDVLSPISYAEIAEKDGINQIDLGSNKLNKKASESVSKLTSSVSYDSLYENVDVDIDVMSSSVKETIILNNRDNVPEQFSYYIKAEGLTAELYEDNSVHFANEYGEDIFNIPAPYMFDSSENPENNYDIKVDIQDYEKGYLLTFIPDSDWLQNSERAFPVMIDPEVQISNSNIHVYNLSEARPNSVLHYNKFKIGGSIGDRYEAVISCPTLFNSIDASVITDAKLYVGFSRNTEMGKFDVYSFNQDCIPQWSACGDNNISTTYITSSILPISYYYECPFDLTNLVQSWYNNKKTGRSVGLYMSYIKIVLSTDSIYSGRMFEGGCNGDPVPYFSITYKKDSAYTLTHAPYKYNSYNNTSNFQDKMNCYAYALQVYYKGEGDYALLPGEFGISNRPNVDEYNISNYGSLTKAYRDQYSDIKMAVQYVRDNDSRIHPPQDVYDYDDVIMTNTVFLQAINRFSNFIEEQMRRDSLAMNFSLQRINCTSDFRLPSDFDEQSERIIAMITYYLSTSNNNGKIDSHFFLRNGNGTCSEHGGTCSIWTQKNGNQTVKSATYGEFICDQTIKDLAFDLPIVAAQTYLYDKNDIRYYRINKDTDLYNSYCLDGHYDDCTGTQYIDASTRNQ